MESKRSVFLILAALSLQTACKGTTRAARPAPLTPANPVTTPSGPILPVSVSTPTPTSAPYAAVHSSAPVILSTPVAKAPPLKEWRTQPNAAFRAGESYSFVVKWGLITGGRSSLMISAVEPVAGRPAFHIVSEAQSAGLVEAFYKTRDRNETWLDVQSLSTVRYEKHIREGHYKVEAVVELDQVNHRYRDYFNRLDKGTTEYFEGDLPLYAMDVLGSLYYVRTMPLEVGQEYTFDVYEGKKIWPLLVTVQKRETVKVAAGKFDCFRVEPVLREPGIFVTKGKKLQVWLTTDPTHMPVMMRSEIFIGHVSAELVSYILPVSSSTAVPPL